MRRLFWPASNDAALDDNAGVDHEFRTDRNGYAGLEVKVTAAALVALAALAAMPAAGDFRLDSDGIWRPDNILNYRHHPLDRIDRDDSSIDDNPRDDTPPAVHVIEKVMHLIPNSPSPGTWEFTIAATDADGQSAELLFTAVVTARLRASEIVIQDPVSTEEGQTVVNLSHYFSGPEDVAFTS